MNRSFRYTNLRHQNGSFLIELTVALIILSLIAVQTLKSRAEAARMELAAVQGDNLGVLQGAGVKYTSEFFSELQSGAPITKGVVTLVSGTGDGQTYAPTIANLKAMGYLDASFSAQSMFSNGSTPPGNYKMRVLRVPAGCELVSVNSCDIEGFAYPDQPITAGGSTEPDGPAISAMIAPLGGAGGFSLVTTPGTVFGNGLGWTWTNPLAGNPAGVVVAKFGYNSGGLAQFVRMNDTRDPNLQGNLTVAERIKAKLFVTDIKNIGDACTEDNAIASGAAAGVICTNGTWQSLGDRAALGAACTVDGKVATSTSTGEQLICKNSVYRKSSSFMALNILKSRVTVKDLDVVAKPTCDAGFTPDRLITLTQITTDVSVAPPKQGMYATTIDQGASWQVIIRLRTDLGTESSGNVYNVTAVMNVECKQI